MIKCQYCKVINNKNYGTCDKCGAPLVPDEDTDNDYDGVTLHEIRNYYANGFITKEECQDRLAAMGYPTEYSEAITRITLSQWKAKVKELGINRIADGIASVQSMSDLTLEDNIKRATAFIKENAKFHHRKE